MSDVTRILEAVERGDRQAANELLPLVYDKLRKLAAHHLANERPGQTLQPTALVHEAYLRLVGPANANGFASKGHFFSAAAEAMRRILIDLARRRQATKRGGQLRRVALEDYENSQMASDEQLLAISEALDRLALEDRSAADYIKLRYFGGFTT